MARPLSGASQEPNVMDFARRLAQAEIAAGYASQPHDSIHVTLLRGSRSLLPRYSLPRLLVALELLAVGREG
jgi:hypothetical protein